MGREIGLVVRRETHSKAYLEVRREIQGPTCPEVRWEMY
jgi:hypothetical protein